MKHSTSGLKTFVLEVFTGLDKCYKKRLENTGKLIRQFIGQFPSGWLRKSKAACSIWEICITGEVDDVSIPTVKSGMERIPYLVRGYKMDDIWNMDKLGLIFDLLPDKGLTEKVKSKKGVKKAKLCLTNVFFCKCWWAKGRWSCNDLNM